MLGVTYTILGDDPTLKERTFVGVSKNRPAAMPVLSIEKVDPFTYSEQQLRLQKLLQELTGKQRRKTFGYQDIIFGTLYAFAYSTGSMSPDLYSPEIRTYDESALSQRGLSGGVIL